MPMRKTRLFCLSRVALKHKKTDLSLETSSAINFEFIKFVNCLPLTKTNIGNLRVITIFDKKCPQTKMQQHIDFPDKMSSLAI